VRLALKPQSKRISLSWSAQVPWTNQSQKYPWHLIYRAVNETDESKMVLIDSAFISAGRFTYIDSGQYHKTPLRDDDVYFYKVMTRGGYGNKHIKEPLLNFLKSFRQAL